MAYSYVRRNHMYFLTPPYKYIDYWTETMIQSFIGLSTSSADLYSSSVSFSGTFSGWLWCFWTFLVVRSWVSFSARNTPSRNSSTVYLNLFFKIARFPLLKTLLLLSILRRFSISCSRIIRRVDFLSLREAFRERMIEQVFSTPVCAPATRE